MRHSITAGLILLLLVGHVSAGKPEDKCRKKKEQSKQTTVATTDETEGDKAPVTQPVPDPVPQSMQSQVKFLADGLSDLPPNPKPGECYVRVKQTAQYEVVREKVLVKEASVRYEIVPAKFKDVQKKILIRPATVRYEVIPEKWGTRMEEVVLLPEHEQFTATETKFREEKASFEILAERVYWKRGAAPLSSDKNMTDDILCLVREKPQYKDYTKKLIDRPAKLDKKDIQTKTEMVEIKVLERPSKVKEIKVPAEYKTITVRELVEPASRKMIRVPAETMDVERQVLIEQERMVWQRVLCDTNVTQEVVTDVQSRLKKKGFNPGSLNGRLTPQTCEAIKKYQKANKLSEGALTYEFLDHIGVNP